MTSRITRSILLVLLFLASFFAVSAPLETWLTARLPEPTINLFFDKRDHYLAKPSHYDTLFVGSSRTYRQVDVPALERALKGRGCDWHVFNFGVPNLTYEESLYLLEIIRDTPNPSLRRLAIEEPVGANVYPQRALSDRLQFFSDWHNTRLRFQNIATFEEAGRFRLLRSLVALEGFIYRTSGLGKISRALFPESYAAQDTDDEELRTADLDFDANGGYTSLDDRSRINDKLLQVHADFLKTVPEFNARVTAARQPSTVEGADARAALIAELVEGGRQATDDVRLFVPPSIDRLGRDRALVEATDKAGIDTLMFNDPVNHPAFWNPDVWFDSAHLNGRGAALLSEAIAERWCQAGNNDARP